MVNSTTTCIGMKSTRLSQLTRWWCCMCIVYVQRLYRVSSTYGEKISIISPFTEWLIYLPMAEQSLNVRQCDFRARLCTQFAQRVTYGKPTVWPYLAHTFAHKHFSTLNSICFVHVFTASKIECGIETIVAWATIFYAMCTFFLGEKSDFIFTKRCSFVNRRVGNESAAGRTTQTWQKLSENFRSSEMFAWKVKSVCRSPGYADEHLAWSNKNENDLLECIWVAHH